MLEVGLVEVDFPARAEVDAAQRDVRLGDLVSEPRRSPRAVAGRGEEPCQQYRRPGADDDPLGLHLQRGGEGW
jgi:hypothetical protein